MSRFHVSVYTCVWIRVCDHMTDDSRPPLTHPCPGSYDKACLAYDNHRRRPKEQRNRCTNNADMIRIVAKFLMHRDQPFRDVHQVIW